MGERTKNTKGKRERGHENREQDRKGKATETSRGKDKLKVAKTAF